MKPILLKTASVVALALVTFDARAQIPTPAQQQCYLLSGTVAMTATWRDNGVPLTISQHNVDEALIKTPATAPEREQWRRAVEAIYDSHVTAAQVEAALRKNCP